MGSLNIEFELWARRARHLAWLGLFLCIAEALTSFFLAAGNHSLSLFGFGADSVLEAASALVLLYSIRGQHWFESPKAERSAQRQIAVLLMALAVYLGISAYFHLKSHGGSEEYESNLGVAGVSLLAMTWLYRAKMKCARILQSPPLRADAACTLSCIWLSALLFLGAALGSWSGLRGLDALTTFAMAAYFAREGMEAFDEADFSELEEQKALAQEAREDRQ